MPDVAIHRIRSHAILDRVSKGETFTVTRRGKPVALLSPVPMTTKVSWTWGSTGGLQAEGSDGQTYIVPDTCKGNT